MSEVVPKDVLLERDAPIGIPLLDTFPRQVRKAMWEKMNKEFAGAMVTRAQARGNQELLLSRPKVEGDITEKFKSSCDSEGASEEREELELLSTEVLEEIQSTKEYEVDKGSPMEEGRRTDETKIDGNCDQMDQNYICENIEFNFDDALFLGPGWG